MAEPEQVLRRDPGTQPLVHGDGEDRPGAPSAPAPGRTTSVASPSAGRSRAAIMMTGTGARNESTAAATSVCGAMTTMPSTPWSMKCSSTRCIVSAS